jgi:D-alanyl-D-alanine carboxypeptidase
MEEMRTTVPEGESASGPGRSYGLGLERVETVCGTVWGHDGALPGYGSDTYTDGVGGRSMTVFTTSNFGILTQPEAIEARTDLIDAAACAMFGAELPA